jgi:hypothetical protein
MDRIQAVQKKYYNQNEEDESEEIEFIDDTTPGPGHYHPNSISTSASQS